MNPFQTSTPNEIRVAIRQRRNLLTTEEQEQASQNLLTQLSSLSVVKQATHIALYLSNDGELDTTDMIHWCWQQGIKTYLPVIHPFSKGHLLFLRYHQNTVMKANCYGILEPKLNVLDIIPVQKLDIILTPLVAFDHLGNRMGMGGGFYDRTLANWYQQYQQNNQAKPLPIGIAHDCQKVDYIPTQAWDIPLPQIITPSQRFRFS
ncbi:5-formyltetrahydrofolate cyclo-ligase [Thalassotalea piscium]